MSFNPQINSVQNGDLVQYNSSSNTWNNVHNTADILVSGSQNKFVTSILNTKGDIPVYNGLTVQKLTVGDSGDVLMADPTRSAGLKWQRPVQNIADLFDTNLSSPPDKALIQYDSSTNKWINITNSIDHLSSGTINKFVTSILNTKGDLAIHNGLTVQKLDVGPSGSVLQSDSSRSTGVKWDKIDISHLNNFVITNPQNGDILQYNLSTGKWYNVPNSLTTVLLNKGDIAVNDGVSVRRLSVGADGSVLTANSSSSMGVDWEPNPLNLNITNLNNNDLLHYNLSTNKWENISNSADNLVSGNTNLFVNDVLTTDGDIVYENNSVPTRLPIGAENQVLTVINSIPVWNDLPLDIDSLSNMNDVSITNPNNNDLLQFNSVTGKWENITNSADNLVSGIDNIFPKDIITNVGDIMYENTKPDRLPIGSSGQVLTAISGLPQWSDLPINNLETLQDVALTNVNDANLLQYSSTTNKWENVSNSADNLVSGTVNKFINDVLTTNGDIVYENNSVPSRLQIGSENQILTVINGLPSWSNIPSDIDNLSNLSDVVLTSLANKNLLQYNSILNKWENVNNSADNIISGTTNKFINDILVNSGDTVYNNNGIISNLSIGSNNQVLTVNNGIPVWSDLPVDIDSLSNLSDTTLTALANKNLLQYNSTINKWENVSNSADNLVSGSTNKFVNDILVNSGDTVYNNNGIISNLQIGSDNQVLTVNNGIPVWSNLPVDIDSLSNLSDITLTALANNNFLKYNSITSKWENVSNSADNLVSGSTNKFINDVLTTNGDLVYENNLVPTRLPVGSSNQVLSVINGLPVWTDLPTDIDSLSNLSDITLTALANKNLLQYNSTINKWENVNNSADNLVSGSTNKFVNDILINSGDTIYNNNGAISNLQIGSNNQVLTVNNGVPVWSDLPTDVDSIANLSDTSLTALANKNLLQYNSTSNKWENVTNSADNLVSGSTNKFINDVLTTNGDLVYENNSVPSRLPIGANNQVLTVNNGLPVWSDFPVDIDSLSNLSDTTLTALANKNLLQYNSTLNKWENVTNSADNLVSGSTNKFINDILINSGDTVYNNNGTISNLSIGLNNQVLTVNNGVPVWLNLPVDIDSLSNLSDTSLTALANKNLLQYNSTSNKWENVVNSADNLVSGLTNKFVNDVLTTNGDLVYENNSVPTRLAIGSNNQVLTVNNGLPVWSNLPVDIDSLSNLSDVTLTALANNNLLKYNSISNTWENVSNSADNLVSGSTNKFVNDILTTVGDIIYENGSLIPSRLQIGTNNQVLTVNNGVPVWLDLPTDIDSLSNLSDTTLTALVNKNLLQYNSTINKWENVTNSADNLVSGTVNKFPKDIITSVGDILYENTNSQPDRLAIGTNNQVLTVINGLPVWSNLPIDIDSLSNLSDITLTALANKNLLQYNSSSNKWENVSNSADNLVSGSTNKFVNDILTTDGDIVYENNSVPTRLAIGSSGQYLSVINGLPVWSNLPTDIDSLSNLSDVTLTALANNNLLQYNSTTNKWENVTNSADNIVSGSINKFINDVLINSGDTVYNNNGVVSNLQIGSENQVLTVNNGVPVWLDLPIDIDSLSNLSDTSLTALANKNLLQYNSSTNKWENVINSADNLVSGTTNVFVNDVLSAVGDIIYENGSLVPSRLQVGSNNQVLTVNNGLPVWSNLPVDIDSLSNLSDTTLTALANKNLLQYNSTTNKWENVSNSADNLVSGSINKFINDVLTIDGDLVYENNSVPTRLAIGSNNQVLTVNNGVPVWSDLPTDIDSLSNLSDTTLTALANKNLLQYNSSTSKWENVSNSADNLVSGSTNKFINDVLTTDGDIVYENNLVPTRLPIGSNNQVLTVVNSLPVWLNLPTDIDSLSNLSDTTLTALANKNLLQYNSGTNKWENVSNSADNLVSGNTNKFINDVLINSGDTVYNNNGTMSNLQIGSNNQVLTVNNGVPVWSNLPTDIDSISNLSDVTLTALANKNLLQYNSTSNKWENVSNSADNLVSGNTNKFPKDIITSVGDILYENTNSQPDRLAIGSNNQVLTVNNGVPTWSNLPIDIDSLSNLSDTTLTALANKNLLQFNSGTNKWENVSNSADILVSGSTNKFVNDILTTVGDIIYENGSLIPSRLQIGTNNQVLTVNNGVPVWSNLPTDVDSLSNLSDTTLTALANKNLLQYNSILNKWVNVSNSADNLVSGSTNKFVNDILINSGDTVYNNNGIISNLSIGSNNQVLTVNNGIPVWSNLPVDIDSLSNLSDVTLTALANNNLLKYNSISNTWENVSNSADILVSGLTNKFINDILTTDGDIVYENNSVPTRLAIGSNNQVLTVNNGVPVWLDLPTDIDSLSNLSDTTLTALVNKNLLQFNSGTNKWENVSNSADNIVSGNTNKFINDVLVNSGDTVYNNNGIISNLQIGTNNQVLTVNNGLPVWSNLPVDIDSLSNLSDTSLTALANKNLLQYNSITSKWENVTNSADNLVSGSTNKFVNDILTTDGDLVYENNSVPSRLPVGSNGQYLSVINGLPVWSNLPTDIDSLSNLSDVTLTALANNNLLQYNSTTNKWENVTNSADNLVSGTTNKFINDILTSVGDIIYENTNSQPDKLTIGTTGQVLTVNNGIPSWADIPIDSLGNLSDVTLSNIQNTNLLQYNSTTSKWENVSNSADNLVSGSANKFINDVLTTDGDLVYENNLVPTRLAIGTNNQVLTVNNGVPSWSNLPIDIDSLSNLSDTTLTALANKNLLQFNSGTNKWENVTNSADNLVSGSTNKFVNDVLTTDGDLVYENNSVPTRLAVGSSGQVLTVNNGVPAWSNLPTDIDSLSNLSDTTLTALANKNLLQYNSILNKWENVSNSADNLVSGSTNKFINDVLTTNGDLVYENNLMPTRLQIGSENQVLTVNNGFPSWQTSVLESNDNVIVTNIANKDLLQYNSTTNKWENVTNSVDNLVSGNINKFVNDVLITDGDLVYENNLVPTRLPIGSDNQILLVNNGLPSWQTPILNTSSDVNITSVANKNLLQYNSTTNKWENVSNSADNLVSGNTNVFVNDVLTTTGDIVYENNSAIPSRLPIGSNNQVLTVNNGVPVWSNLPVDIDSLSNLSDTTITSVSDKNLLQYNSTTSKWENVSNSADNLTSGNTNKFVNDVLTTDGDLIYENNLVPTRLPIGSDGQMLLVNNGLPVWQTPILETLNNISTSNIINKDLLQFNSSTSKWENVSNTADNLISGNTNKFINDVLTNSGDTVYNNNGIINNLQIGTNNQVLTVNNGVPVWSDLPVDIDSLSNLSDTTLTSVSNKNLLQYNSSSNKWENVSNSADNLVSGLTNKFVNDVLMTDGDLVYENNSIPTRLAIGSNDQILQVNNGLPVWQTPILNTSTDVNISSVVDKNLLQYNSSTNKWENVSNSADNLVSGNTNKFVNDVLTTDGDLVYENNSVPTRLAVGSSGQVLTVNNGVPVWSNLPIDVDSLSNMSDTNITSVIDNNLLQYNSTTNKWENVSNSADNLVSGSTNKFINDVLTTNGDLVYENNSVPSRLAIGIENQVLLVNNGIPTWQTPILENLDNVSTSNVINKDLLQYNSTTSKWENVSNSADNLISGNTNKFVNDVLVADGDLVYENNSVPSRLPIGSNNQILTSNNGVPVWSTPILENLDNVSTSNVINKDLLQYNSTTSKWENVSNSADNLISGNTNKFVNDILTTNGDIVYENNSVPSRLPIGTDNQVLKSNNGVPVWSNNSLSTLSDTNLAPLSNNNLLQYNSGTGKWLNVSNSADNLVSGSTNKFVNSVLTNSGDLIYENGSLVPTRLPIGSSGQVLSVNGGFPIWQTPVLNTSTDVNITSVSDNNLLQYNSTTNKWENITNSADNLISGSTNKFVNDVLVADGDLVYENNSVPTRLPIGSDDQILLVNNGLPSWQTPVLNTSSDVNISSVANKNLLQYNLGTNKWENVSNSADNLVSGSTNKFINDVLTTDGDLVYENNSIPTRLSIGTNNQILLVNNGLPTWQTPILENLNNISITNVQNANLLHYNTTTNKWENISNSADNLVSGSTNKFVNSVVSLAGDIIYENNSLVPDRLPIGNNGQVLTVTNGLPSWSNLPIDYDSLTNLSDTNITSVSNNNLLQYNSATSKWINVTNSADRLVSGTTNKFINNVLSTTGDIVYENSSHVPTRLAIGTTGQVLTVTGGLPVWSNLPADIDSLTNLNDVNLTSVANNNLLQYNSTTSKWINVANTADRLVAGTTNKFVNNIISYPGDLIYENSSSQPDRLPIGTNGQILTVSNGVPIWSAPIDIDNLVTLSDVNISNLNDNDLLTYDTSLNQWVNVPNTIDNLVSGSTNKFTQFIVTTPGDLLYENSNSEPDRLPVGNNGQVLTVVNGMPTWNNLQSDIDALTTLSDVNITSLANNNFLRYNLATSKWVNVSNSADNLTSGSTNKFVNSILTTSGDTVYNNAGAMTRLPIGTNNQVLTVSGGLPVWSNLPADIDNLSTLSDVVLTSVVNNNLLQYNSATSKWVNVSNSADRLVSGATNKFINNVISTPGDLVYENSSSQPDRIPIGTNNQVLTVIGGLPVWSNLPADTDSLDNMSDTNIVTPVNNNLLQYNSLSNKWINVTNSADNLVSGTTNKFINSVLTTAGDLVYENGSLVPTRLPIGSSGQFLSVSSGLPSWVTVPAGLLSTLQDVTVTSVTNNNLLQYNSGLSKWINVTNSADNLVSGSTNKFINSILTTSGDTVYNNAGTISRLPIGTNGQYLSISGGLPTWSTVTNSLSLLTDVTITSVADKQLLRYDTTSSKWINVQGLTTKGDLLTFGTDYYRLGVGSNNQVLVADSTQPNGLKWGPVPGGLPTGTTYGSYVGWNGSAWVETYESVRIGAFAGYVSQYGESVAIGASAARFNQGTSCVAIGTVAGQSYQSQGGIAIGAYAGFNTQGYSSIAIGSLAAQSSQGQHCISIGSSSGNSNQGNYSIAIGAYAGRNNQHANSIVINASGTDVNSVQANSFYVKPIRNLTNSQILMYDTTNYEVTYNTISSSTLSDFNITSVANNNLLQYNSGSSKWVNVTNSADNLVSGSTNKFVNSVLTTAGDLVYENGSLVPTRLPIGTNGQYLSISGGFPVWSTITDIDALSLLTDVVISSVSDKNLLQYDNTTSKWINVTNSADNLISGTTNKFINSILTTSGDTVYNNAGTISRLPIGTDGQYLSISGGFPSWSSLSLELSSLTDANITSVADKQLLRYDTISSKWINVQGLTTKGDLLTFGTEFDRLPVGTDNQVLVADSAQPLGIKWSTHSSLPSTTTHGDYVIYDGTNWIAKTTEVYIGRNAGGTQQVGSVAIGHNAGVTQGIGCVSVGHNSSLLQDNGAIAIGDYASSVSQGGYAIAIGTNATDTQVAGSIILNASFGTVTVSNAGFYVLPIRNVSASNLLFYNTSTKEITYNTISSSTLSDFNITSVADKQLLRYDTTSSKWINVQGLTTKGDLLTYGTEFNRLPVGTNNQVLTADSSQPLGIKWATASSGLPTGTTEGSYLTWNGSSWIEGNYIYTKSVGSLSFGSGAGYTSQAPTGIAIGNAAGNSTQGTHAISLGNNAGNTSQGNWGIAIGNNAGANTQGFGSIAMGRNAGSTTQSSTCISIGYYNNGQTSQGSDAISIGHNAGYDSQGSNAIAIGTSAGANNQHANSIVLCASGGLNTDGTSRFYVDPIRSDVSTSPQLIYNASTKEITYSSSSIKYKKNVIDLSFDTTAIYRVQPREFDSKSNDTHHIGFIAEEVNDVDTNFTWKTPDENGVQKPEGLEWYTMVTYMIAEMKKLRAEIDTLKQQVNNPPV